MKKLLVLLFLLPIVLFAQDNRDYFTYLKEVKVENWEHSGMFLPSNYTPADDVKFDKDGLEVYPIAHVTIYKGQKVDFVLWYTDGPSGDPAFEFYELLDNGESEYLFTLAGTQIFIPGNGNLYVTGHTNNMFDKRKKFVFNGETVEEVVQPYYSVSMQTKTLKNIQLYSDCDCTQKLAVVAANSDIEIVAAEYTDGTSRKYLIRTPFGLMGWWELDREYPASEEIEGLFYAGD